MTQIKEIKRIFRHKRISRKIKGSIQRPRLVVYRSIKNIYIQLIDDIEAKTLLSLSTASSAIKEKIGAGGDVRAAALLGEMFAKLAKDKGIEKIVFDRSGYAYHGRIKALAETLRKGGLVF